MEKIYFDDETYIWKSKFVIDDYKQEVLDEVKVLVEKLQATTSSDSFTYCNDFKKNGFKSKNNLDKICKFCVGEVENLYKNEVGLDYSSLYFQFWVNIIRAVDPRQKNFEAKSLNSKYHNHEVSNNKSDAFFIPDYTFVHYIQMPEFLENNDGLLFILGKNNVEYSIKPEENDIIMMKANLYHSPMNAPKSKKDRIVMAGNIKFDNSKKIKTLL